MLAETEITLYVRYMTGSDMYGQQMTDLVFLHAM